jgi:hypothetical protein
MGRHRTREMKLPKNYLPTKGRTLRAINNLPNGIRKGGTYVYEGTVGNLLVLTDEVGEWAMGLRAFEAAFVW